MTEHLHDDAISEYIKLKMKLILTQSEIKTLKEHSLYNATHNPFKRCKHCNILKPLTEFYKNPLKKQGVFDYCKECAKTRAKQRREYVKANKERERNLKNAVPA